MEEHKGCQAYQGSSLKLGPLLGVPIIMRIMVILRSILGVPVCMENTHLKGL